MAKTVEFNAKDVFGQNFKILDTFNNVKIVSDGLDKVYKAIDKVDQEKGNDVRLLDYSNAICPTVLKETARLLGRTSKADLEKMGNLSYSTVQDFYAEACQKFTGIELPTVELMQKQVKEAQERADRNMQADADEETESPK